jgi:orotate phosphoribosyltransferase
MTSKLKDMLTGAVKTGDFTLASGKKSNYYVNVKNVYTDPAVLREIAKEMAKILRGHDIDRIAGVALGAVPIAVALSLELGIPFVLIRNGKKGHGTNMQIEGELVEGDRVVMVEDVTTTGGSVLSGVGEIRKKGTCDTVITVIDREEGASGLLSGNGIEIKSLVTAKELLGGD